MHKERVIRLKKSATWGSLFLAVVIATSIGAFVLFNQQKPAHAADVSSSYTFKDVKIGGGGFVTGMVFHPTTPNLAFARTDVGGAYRWDQGSQSWVQLVLASHVPNPVSSDYNVEGIAVSASNDQVVYMATGSTTSGSTPDGRVLKSTNQGRDWTDSGQRWFADGNAEVRQGTERLSVDPLDSNIVYFSTRTQGLWVSTDGAAHWTQVPTDQIPVGSTPGGVKYALFDPTGGSVNGRTKRIVVHVTGVGFYRSDDGGASWNQFLNNGLTSETGQIASNGMFYASSITSTGSSVIKYDLNTWSWQNVASLPGGSYYKIAVDPTNPQRVFAVPGGANGQFWRTTNGGTSWDTITIHLTSPNIPWIVNTDEGYYLSSGAIAINPSNTDELWFGQGMGAWKITNSSQTDTTWTFISQGIEEMVTGDIIAPPGGHAVTANYDRNGFYHASLDQYPDHTNFTSTFSSGLSLDYSGNNPNFVAGISSDYRGLNPDNSGYSTDGGKTWKQFSGSRNTPDLFGGNIAVSATDPNNIVWLPTWNRKPYVTSDEGANWNKIGAFNNVGSLHGQVWWGAKRALASDKVDGGVFYIYSTDNGGEFFRSTDGGYNWQQAPGTAPSSLNNDSHVFGQVRAVPGKAQNVWISSVQGGLSYTTNRGDSWTKVSAVQEAKAFGFGKTLDGASYPTVFVYGKVNNQQGLWRSSDQGASWDFITTYPADIYDGIRLVQGDMSVAGRVYVGFEGRSYVYGDTTQTSGGGNGGTVIANGRYALVNHNSNKVIDDPDSGGVGSQIQQWTNFGNINQKWDIASVGNGYYKITSAANGLALDVDGGSTQQHSNIVLQSYSGSDEQLWSFVATSGGNYKIVNKHSGLMIGVTGASTDNGVKLIQWPANESSDQEWNFQPA